MAGSILILDYCDFEREKIKYLLNLIGNFSIITISSIAEYYSRMDSLNNISLLIMEIAFPNETEGFEILSALRKKTCKDIPVIITAKSDKSEYRDRAFTAGVNEYIIKPYNSARLESSIRRLVKIEDKFYYDTKGVDNIVMSFGYFVEKQLYMAEAVKQPLSIIVISALGSNDIELEKDPEYTRKRELACNIAVESIKPMLSISDVAVRNNDKEILVVLPLTDSSYAELCKKKIIEGISTDLNKIEEEYGSHFYSVAVTYPEEGKDLQALMKSAFNKIADKDLYTKTGRISQDTKKYASKLYSKYTRWF